MANKEQLQEQPQASPEKLKPKFYDKIADSFGFGKRWEKEAAFLEALEAQEETPENIEAATETVETIEKQAASTIAAEGEALQGEVAETAKRVESLGVQDPQIHAELASVQKQADAVKQPSLWKKLWNWFTTNKWERMAADTGKLNNKDTAAKKAEKKQLDKDLAVDFEKQPSRAKKAALAAGEGLRAVLDTSTDAAVNIASSVPGSSKNRMNKELRQQQKEDAATAAFEDSFDVPEVGTVIDASETEELPDVHTETVDASSPADMQEREEVTTFTPIAPYATAHEVFTTKTAEFLRDNPHGRTQEEQTKFAGFAAYESSTDSGLQAEVDALRKEWATAEGLEGDYDEHSEQYKLQTGEALRQVMETSAAARSAKTFEELSKAVDATGDNLTTSFGETIDTAALKEEINQLKLLAMNPDFSPAAIPLVTQSITRTHGLRESVQRLMNEMHKQIAEADVAGLEGMAEQPEVAGLGVEMEAAADMDTSDDEPQAAGLEGLADLGGMAGGFGIETDDDGKYDSLLNSDTEEDDEPQSYGLEGMMNTENDDNDTPEATSDSTASMAQPKTVDDAPSEERKLAA